MAKWVFVILFAGVAAIFIGLGVYLVWDQDSAIRNAKPTTATIDSSRVAVHEYYSKGRRRTSRSLEIKYTYTVGGQKYSGTKIAPFGDGPDSLDETVRQFPAGKHVQAWYDGRDKSRAFLLKYHDFVPYLFILFPMIHLAIGVLFATGTGKPTPPALISKTGTFALNPDTSIAKKFNTAAKMTALWFTVGGLACAHYYSVAEKPIPNWVYVVSGIYFGIGLIPLYIASHYWRLRARVADAGISIDQHPIRRGYPVKVRIAIPLIGGGRVDFAMISLQCRRTQVTSSGGKRQVTTTTSWERSETFVKEQELITDKTLSADLAFMIPPDQPPSTPKGQRGYPKHEYRFFVHIKRPGPDYKANFKVEVV